MTTHAPSPATDRDLAISRLRRLTTGVAVAGVAAVGGLGYLAALHYSGQSTAGAVAVANTATTTTTSTDDSTTASDDDAVSSSTASGSTLQGSTGQVSSSSGSAQVTTGGS